MAKRKARMVKLDAQFEEFIAKRLDPEGDHLDKDTGIIIDFEYFLKLVTAIFFWKKYRFEADGEKYAEMRREMLKGNNMQMYKMMY